MRPISGVAIAVGLAGCGRIGFAPEPQAIAIVDVNPRWVLPTGGPVQITLDGDASGVAVELDAQPCVAPAIAGTTIACTAPPHAPGVVELAVTRPDGMPAMSRFVYITPGDYQLGSPLDDRTSGVAVDRDGNVIVTGATTGDLDGANRGDYDAVTAKYDASGVLLWVRQLGSPLYDYARDVAVDPSGDVTITGYTAGDLGGTGNAGSNDVFVARYAPDGTLRWVTQTGSAGDDQAWDLGVDDAGDTVVAIQTTGALAGTNAGGQDYAIARYTPTGALAWIRQAGTPADDFGHSVAVAPDGTAFLVGYTTGALAGSSAGGLDAFVARYDVDGTRAWIRQRGGPGDDQAQDVQLDPAGDVWVAGSTTAALDGATSGGGLDVFAMRFDPAGTWILTRQYGGAGTENTFGISAAADGTIYLACTTTATFDGAPYIGGGNDFCLIALDRDGTHRWTRIAGGPGVDQDSSCAVDVSVTGLVYLSLITDGSLDGLPDRGGNDIAVAKLDALGIVR